MVQFKKIQLTGFKSFVDTTELEIGKGLTGIVGPNGCGKSNLVESLRWSMGETSAKRMRGSGMEDVIFSGTSSRPARNTAEVTLWIDNTDRKAPAELNDADELQIVRRIERDMGSNYKVNGKNVRAKDVQLLFADCSIGANSPALVSQGRVADLINAKPSQRRLILEEAAGISGLHARKHEAELKLRAAENNLLRIEDVLGTMETQMQGLKKQARQASRYRNLSGHIQRAEALVLHLKWSASSTALAKAEEAFNTAESIVREKMILTTSATTKQTDETTVLPELRKKEANASAALQRIRLAYSTLENEERQVAEEQQKTDALFEQVQNDIQHENDFVSESKGTLKRLDVEKEELLEIINSPEDNREEIIALRDELQDVVSKLDIELTSLTESTASTEARKDSLERQEQSLSYRLENLSSQVQNKKEELEALTQSTPEHKELENISKELASIEKQYEDIKQKLEKLELEKMEAEDLVESKRDKYEEARKLYTDLTAEADAISRLLSTHDTDEFEPVLDSVSVDTGLEKALAVALGDDLQASLDNNAPIFWYDLPTYEKAAPLPNGIKSLDKYVNAPKALSRRLSQIGLIEDDSMATDIIKKLQPGQAIVSKSGSAWRWDGFVITENAVNPAAIRLEHKNRLIEVQTEISGAEKAQDKAEKAMHKAKEVLETFSDKLHELKDQRNQIENLQNDLRQRSDRLTQEISDVTARISSLKTTIESDKEHLSQAQSEFNEVTKELKSLPDSQKTRGEIEIIREDLTTKRDALSEQQALFNQIRQQEEVNKQRLDSINREITSWSDRQSRVGDRLEELNQRKIDINRTLEQLSIRPAKIEKEKQEFLTKIQESEKARDETADDLAKAENQANETTRELKELEASLADAREARAMAQANVNTNQHTLETINEQIQEKFNCHSEDLLSKVEIDPETVDMPELGDIQSKLERLIRERENMGPVNLRAEVESQELIDEMSTMETEKEDLTAAINKLRHGIGRLNKEARERLLKAFDVVNEHFQELFIRLFGGGKAHLELVDADDPLQAGLEIYAQPPGKKLQVLSLLSGGEQTLTSIALIFGMFLTNPAPICVLDEIDAPLDDSNVDRVCSLLEELTKSETTRFIVITHHRMTMARMNRLYGVTMSEKGVSQLVSVDLEQRDLLDNAAAA